MRCRSGAGKQLFEIVRQLVPRDGAGSFILFDDVRLALGRGWLRPARHIDRQATSDRHHPGERGRTGWIVVASIAPDLKIGLLDDFAGEVMAAQDPQHDAVEFGARRSVEALEGHRVPFGNRRKQPCDFDGGRHENSPSSWLDLTIQASGHGL